MSNAKDEQGNLLADEKRLNGYGKFLRSTSLDELPELLNVIKGDMTLVGPRPQLIRDLVFMDENTRRRHLVRPGLTGLAQVNGRNNITWEEKFEYDLQYVEKHNAFFGDVKIMLQTVGKVIKKDDVNRDGTASDIDYGQYLYEKGLITEKELKEKLEEAKEIV